MPRFSLCRPSLAAFSVCAAQKSFSKAAKLLYLSTPALIKQIEALEDGIGAKLFERSPRGLSLTPAGEALKADAEPLLRHAEGVMESVRRAAQAAEAEAAEIVVGTSDIFSGRCVVDLWCRLQPQLAGTRVRLVSYENTREAADEMLASLTAPPSLSCGINVIAGVFDDAFLAHYGCDGLELEQAPIGLAAALTSGFSAAQGNEPLPLSALAGQRIYAPQRGLLEAFDRAREFIEASGEPVELADFNFLDLDVFNRVEREGAAILNIARWTEPHPLFRWRPIAWPAAARFGLICSKHPNEALSAFLAAVRTEIAAGRTL